MNLGQQRGTSTPTRSTPADVHEASVSDREGKATISNENHGNAGERDPNSDYRYENPDDHEYEGA